MDLLIKEFGIKILTGNYWSIKNVIKNELSVLSDDKILDLGCGTGVLAPLFMKKNYTGIDIDLDLIAYAKHHHPGYHFEKMSGSKLSLPGLFDKVLIVGVLHHMDNKTLQVTSQLLKKHLKRGATILAIEAIPPIYKWNMIGKFLREHDEGHHIHKADYYAKMLSPYFKIEKTYEKRGGIVDYGVIKGSR